MKVNLLHLEAELKLLDSEAELLGVSKTLRDRIRAIDIVLEVVERERQKKGAV
jgi:hypothetical protein